MNNVSTQEATTQTEPLEIPANGVKNLKVRAARAADADALTDLLMEAENYHSRNLPDVFQTPSSPSQNRKYIMGLLLNEESAVLVAELDHCLVGFIHVNIGGYPELPIFSDEKFAVIQNIIVRENHRDQGVGKTLVLSARQWARDQALSRIQLNVWEFNQSAIGLYESLGFETINRRMQADV